MKYFAAIVAVVTALLVVGEHAQPIEPDGTPVELFIKTNTIPGGWEFKYFIAKPKPEPTNTPNFHLLYELTQYETVSYLDHGKVLATVRIRTNLTIITNIYVEVVSNGNTNRVQVR